MKPDKQTLHYAGRVISVTTDEVLLPNGHRAQLEVVHHPGGAAAVALDEHDRVCLLRQYRYVADGWLWELPAGKLEPDEPPLRTAQRELAEEAGISAHAWRSLGVCLSSPGVFAERLHLFLAGGLTPAGIAHERAEVIEVHWVPFARRASGRWMARSRMPRPLSDCCAHDILWRAARRRRTRRFRDRGRGKRRRRSLPCSSGNNTPPRGRYHNLWTQIQKDPCPCPLRRMPSADESGKSYTMIAVTPRSNGTTRPPITSAPSSRW